MRRLAIVLVLFAGGCSFVESDGNAFKDARTGTGGGTSAGSGSTTGSASSGSTGSIDRCAGVTCPDQPCMAGTCVDGGCSYTVTPDVTCDDANPCTSNDQCEADGGCVGVPDPDAGACDDNNPCTANDHCVAGICEGSSYTCTADAMACQASSVCDGDGGCIVTSTANGTACTDDNNACTSDVCDGGLCDHPAKIDGTGCGNGLTCSGGTCQGVCVVGSTTYDAGVVNPGNDCQSCQPGTSTSAWSPLSNTTPCHDDGNPCTVDECDGVGTCAHGTYVTDGTTCTDGGICDQGRCQAECDIGGLIRAEDFTNPSNDCQSCQPQKSTSNWSNKTSTTPCSLNGGTNNGTCDGAGNCKLPNNQACTSNSQCYSDACDYTNVTGTSRQCVPGPGCASCLYDTGSSCLPIQRCAVQCGGGITVKYCSGDGGCNETINTCSGNTTA